MYFSRFLFYSSCPPIRAITKNATASSKQRAASAANVVIVPMCFFFAASCVATKHAKNKAKKTMESLSIFLKKFFGRGHPCTPKKRIKKRKESNHSNRQMTKIIVRNEPHERSACCPDSSSTRCRGRNRRATQQTTNHYPLTSSPDPPHPLLNAVELRVVCNIPSILPCITGPSTPLRMTDQEAARTSPPHGSS